MLKQKPIENGMKLSFVVLAILLLGPLPVEGQKRLNVVTTLPTYAAIAREVVGDLAEVQSIARGDEDPHFVNPRPSFAAKVQRADLFIATGLDLELWVPAILDRANNSKVDDGGSGNVVAYAGIRLLEVPDSPSRAGGDVHVFGNPHIHTDPINGILIARNIAAGLKRIDPANGPSYNRNLADFEHRVMERLFGEQILELIGAETILPLARNYQLWGFLESQSYEGRPLTGKEVEGRRPAAGRLATPRSGATYASRLDTLIEKSRTFSMTEPGRPGPLSATVIPAISSTVIEISGETPASSQASSELSTASLMVVRRALVGLSKPSRCRFLVKNSETEISR